MGKGEEIRLLQGIRRELEISNSRLLTLIRQQKLVLSATATNDKILDGATLLLLPDHLRKTAMALYRVGRATATEIADATQRARAVESAYLNQLCIMGYLKKERRGRKTYFYVS